MADRTARWIGYDWFKLLVALLLVALLFWLGARPQAAPAPAAAPTSAPAPTLPPTPAPTVAPASAPAPTLPPTPAPAAPTASPAAATPVAGGALLVIAPAEGAQLPVGPIAISGTGPVGGSVEVLDGDLVIGAATVAGDGTWGLTYTPDGPGTAAIGARLRGGEVEQRPVRVTIGAGAQGSCASLAAGCEAWVTRQGGLSLRMRAAAGTDQEVIALLPVGTQLRLTEGPSDATGLAWWRVTTRGGSEGWVSAENLVLQPD